MDFSRTAAILVLVLLIAIVLFRSMNIKRLTSGNKNDRLLKIFYIIGLSIVLLFAVGEVLLQTHII